MAASFYQHLLVTKIKQILFSTSQIFTCIDQPPQKVILIETEKEYIRITHPTQIITEQGYASESLHGILRPQSGISPLYKLKIGLRKEKDVITSQ